MKHQSLKRIILVATLLLVIVLQIKSTPSHLSKSQRKQAENEVTLIINRFTNGALPVKVFVDLEKDVEGCDTYRYSFENKQLNIHASSGVAACRAFYDYVKSKGAGISSWSGSRYVQPEDLTTEPRTVTSPYRDHQYMNVVTYGYTTPYWDAKRWDEEIDWMALHGIDMPLLLLAQEQVYREVFYDMGLSKQEVDEWEVGPAHLPWMRMGNLSGNSFDGPLGEEWNKKQVDLCKHVIERMRRLGMKPICPAFGGFVPKAFVNHYDGTIDLTGWDWVPSDYRNHRLNPGSDAFVEVGTRFIKKWEEKFGKCTYYLSDSFNEMEIPNNPELMTAYGDAIYKSLRDANPDAVWTMQGWTVGYQRGSWGHGILEALLKNVPDDKFLLLDMAADYNKCFWNISFDWDNYNGFYNKTWLWSVIPNMGGKNALTGFIDFYANARIEAQQSANRGRLTSYGFAPEGVENNEMLYELICDAGWVGATDSINVNNWMNEYANCRYGKVSSFEEAYHNALRKSVYNSFQDHPQFAWQVRNNIIGKGNVNVNEDFCQGVENLFADVNLLKQHINELDKEGAKLLQADLIEAAAIYTSGKIEKLSARIKNANDAKQKELANELLENLKQLMLKLDRSLTAHPLYNLEVWEDKAIRMADNELDKKRNAVNARRIVSVWYGHHTKDEPVNDYACRVWAGLIRDYYMPRIVGTWNRIINDVPFDQIAFENSFVEKAPQLSEQKALAADEVLDFLVELVKEAKVLGESTTELLADYRVSDGITNHWYTIYCSKENTGGVLTLAANNVLKIMPDSKTGDQFWRFVSEGGSIKVENRWGKAFELNEVEQIAGQSMAFESIASAMIPELLGDDCDRLLNLLENTNDQRLYKNKKPFKKTKLNEAKLFLTQWKNNIAHASYDSFLAAWTPIWTELLK